MQALALRAAWRAEMDEKELLALSGQAYRLAVRILRSREDAEDAVQQACLDSVRQMRSGSPPRNFRAWFLKVAANAARKQLRSRIVRQESKEAAMRREVREGGSAADSELIAALRGAMEALEEKHRLSVALCCEEGLTCREAAEILDLPKSTVSLYVNEGLEELRKLLARAGYAAAPAAVLGALSHTAPPVPATLAAAITKLFSSGAMGKGTGAAAAAKGGIAMKIIVGVVAAGVLAGAVAVVNGVGAGFKPAPTALSSPPAAAPAEGKPAPINEYKGMQEREEVFEFTEKPKVTKDGDKWVITFASKGKCDATVAILGPDGKIVRHLASGVLGVNAPYPFQQNSLSQKVEWDGLTDTFAKADTAGCKAKVSLGLKAKFVRNLGYDPYYIGYAFEKGNKGKEVWMGDGDDGTMVLMQSVWWDDNFWSVRAFTKEGKYVRTVWPPPAKDVEKVGVKLTTTQWGDKSPWSGWFGPWGEGENPVINDRKDPKGDAGTPIKVPRLFAHLGAKNCRRVPRPEVLPPIKQLGGGGYLDRNEDWLYAGDSRTNVKTGQTEAKCKEWGGVFKGAFPYGLGLAPTYDGTQFVCFAPDGLAYGAARVGGEVVLRFDREGKPVPFKENCFEFQGTKLLGTGALGNGRGHFDSLDVNESGMISVGMYSQPIAEAPYTDEIHKKTSLEASKYNQRVKNAQEMGLKLLPMGCYLGVWDRDGKCLTRNAVRYMGCGRGHSMDRDGNIYLALGGILPVGQKHLDGIAEPGDTPRSWGGSIVKFRGLGGKYPVGRFYWAGTKSYPDIKEYLDKDPEAKEPAPADAKTVTHFGQDVKVTGMLWAYPGMSNLKTAPCDCNSAGLSMDNWARLWLPNNAVSGVMVADSNGNRIMRVGKYGNVDDVEADVKEGKDGMRFAYLTSVFASDSWLVCSDPGNGRSVLAALSYAAEETVPAP